MNYRNESNLVTVDKIMILMEEVAVLKSRVKESDTGHIITAVDVIENRIKELRDRIHD